MVLHKEKRTPPDREVQIVLVRAAFTLMEMLVVVAIIVALAGLGGYYFLGQLKEAQKKTAQTQVRTTLSTAVKTFTLNTGHAPQSLQEMLQRQGDNPPVLESSDALKDPWGNTYQYNPNSTNPETGEPQPEIWTTAPDGTKISNFGPARR